MYIVKNFNTNEVLGKHTVDNNTLDTWQPMGSYTGHNTQDEAKVTLFESEIDAETFCCTHLEHINWDIESLSDHKYLTKEKARKLFGF